MKKRLLAIAICLSLTVLQLVGCGGEPAASGAAVSSGEKQPEVIELRFVNWSSSDAAFGEAFPAMYRAYEAANPGIKIKDINIPYNQVLEQLLIMTSGGDAPDAAQIHGSMVSALVGAGALEPLDDLISKEAKEDFLPNALQPLIYDGKMMATPWAPSPDVLYYNKVLLERAGYTEPPKTCDELLQMARDIAALGADENGNKVYGIGIPTKKLPGSGYGYLPFLWAEGGDLVDDKGNVTLDTPAMISALTKTKALIAEEVTPSGLEVNDLRVLFAQGQLGFIYDGDYGFTAFAESSPKGEEFLNDIAAAIPPQNMSVFYEHDLGVFAGSKHQKEAAQFIEWLSGPEAIKIFNEHNGNKTPGRHSVRAMDYYSAQNNPKMQIFLDTLEVSRGFPQQNPGFIKAMEEIAESLQRVSINNEEPAQVAADLQKKVTEIYTR